MTTPLPKRILNSEGFEINRSSSQAAGLVGWWPLGAYPDGRDKSLYANHGVLDNSIDTDVPTPTSLQQRRALEFSGTGSGATGDKDFITIAHHDNYNITGDMTITMWATVNSPAYNTNWYTLLSRNDFSDNTSPYSILWNNGAKKYILYIGTGTGTSTVGTTNNATTYGKWDFITARITGTDMILLVNGISGDTASTFSGSRQTNTRPMRIGGSIYGDPAGDGTYNHGGHIDDVRLYERALSDAEMWTVYNQTKGGGYGDLAAQPTKRLFHFSGTVNLAPTAVALTNKVDSLSEDADTTSATKIADIVVTDDGEGTNTLSVSGTDAASFEVVGTELRLKAGVTLDYEIKNSYAVTVEVDDTEVGSTPDLTVSHVLGILLVPENKQVDLVEGPSSSFDVVTEIRDERRGATGRGVSWQPGPAQVVTYGTRSDPSTQAVLDRLDNRFVTTAASRIG